MELTVIVPVYNQQDLIIRALESIPSYVETIVIDDGSTDKTYQSVLGYMILNPWKNIRLLQNKQNKGVGYTVNRGYDNAIGKYVVLLGSDDYFTKEIENAIKELDGTDLIYFDLEDNAGNIWKIDSISKNTYVGSVKFMRREFIGKTRCPEIRAKEDLYFYQELMKKNPTEKYLNKVVKHYNFPREGSLTDLSMKGMI